MPLIYCAFNVWCHVFLPPTPLYILYLTSETSVLPSHYFVLTTTPGQDVARLERVLVIDMDDALSLCETRTTATSCISLTISNYIATLRRALVGPSQTLNRRGLHVDS